MKRIILINPAHSLGRHDFFHAGRLELSLSKLGYLQSEKLIIRLKETIDSSRRYRVLNSPDSRCQTMAVEMSQQLDCPQKSIKSWLGIDMGDWSRLTVDDIRSSDGNRLEHWFQEETFPAPGGESISDVARRIWPDFVDEVQSSEDFEDLIVLAPTLVLALFAGRILDMPILSTHQLKLGEASTSIFEKAEGGFFQLVQWNRPWHDHLSATESASLNEMDPLVEPFSVIP